LTSCGGTTRADDRVGNALGSERPNWCGLRPLVLRISSAANLVTYRDRSLLPGPKEWPTHGEEEADEFERSSPIGAKTEACAEEAQLAEEVPGMRCDSILVSGNGDNLERGAPGAESSPRSVRATRSILREHKWQELPGDSADTCAMGPDGSRSLEGRAGKAESADRRQGWQPGIPTVPIPDFR